MLTKPTTLVLGAGASVDFSFPTGADLIKRIRTALAFQGDVFGHLTGGDRELFTALGGPQPTQQRRAEFIAAAQTLTKSIGFSRSIDDALYTFGNDLAVVEVGKAAIYEVIRKLEYDSPIYQYLFNNLEKFPTEHYLSTRWPGLVMSYLTSRVRKEEAKSAVENLSIINFNYDCSFEISMVRMLMNAFSLDHKEAASIVGDMTILHPYGSVGPSPLATQGSLVSYFGGFDPNGIMEGSKRIKTFTEEAYDPVQRKKISDTIKTSHQVIFLGFGFHEQNMELLDSGDPSKKRDVWATAYGESLSTKEIISNRIARHVSSQGTIHLFDMKCEDLVKQNGLALFQ